MIKLEDFPEHLASITPKQWGRLFSLIPEIERTEVFGRMVESKLQPDGSYTFPYWTKAEIVSRTGDLIYDELNLLPAYDWMKWKEGGMLLHSGRDFKTLDMVTLCKLLTAIYRMDRFSEGHVVNIFEQDIMLGLLKALQHHVQNNNFP
jgi:Family of unknown function (DUF6508)